MTQRATFLWPIPLAPWYLPLNPGFYWRPGLYLRPEEIRGIPTHNVYDNHDKVVLNLQSSNTNVFSLRTTSNEVLSQNRTFSAPCKLVSFFIIQVTNADVYK